MTGPRDPAAAGRDQLRAGHADRERVIEALKAAFVRGQLARAAAGAGGCLGIAFAAVWLATDVLDPDGLGNPYHPWSLVCLVVALSAVGTALHIVLNGVATSVEQRRSRRPPPPWPAGRSPR